MGWIIKKGDGPRQGDREFLALAPLGLFWTTDVSVALQFAREADAEVYWKCYGGEFLPVRFVEASSAA
jgi:hypothetical protein